MFWQQLLNSPAPLVNYCEAALSGIVARPGYAISNIPYILLGAYLLTRRGKVARAFGVTSLIIGCMSVAYDVTFTFAAQFLDQMGMLFFISMLLYLNLKRIFPRTLKGKLLVQLTIVYISEAILTLITRGDSLELIWGINISIVIITELYAWKRSQPKYDLKSWFFGLGLYAIGQSIWLLDNYKVYCDQTNLFNGRGVFHYFTVVVLYILYKHYSNLEVKF